MKKNLIYMIVFVSMIVCGCGKSENEGEKTELILIHSWGGEQRNHEAMRKIYEEFETENPYIDIKQIAMPSEEMVIEKTKEMLTVGKEPDIIFVSEQGADALYNFMVNEEYVVDIMPYIKADPEFEKQVDDSVIEDNEEGIYLLPCTMSLAGYWYNQRIFELAGVMELPSTYEELIACCQKIEQWAVREKWNTVPLYLDAAAEETIIKAYMADAEGEEMENGVETIIQELRTFTEGNRSDYSGLDNFNIGHCAIYIGDMRKEIEFNDNLRASFVLLPSSKGYRVGIISSDIGYMIGNSGDTTKEEAGIEFLKYMTSVKIQTRIFTETSQIPVNNNIDLKELKNECPKRLYDAAISMRDAEIYEKKIFRNRQIRR